MDVFALLFIVSFLALIFTLTVIYIRKCMNKGNGDVRVPLSQKISISKERFKEIGLHQLNSYSRSYDLESSMMQREVTYSQDEDGNIMILQDGMYITLTPQQQIALKSLLEAHIDTLQFVWSKL